MKGIGAANRRSTREYIPRTTYRHRRPLPPAEPYQISFHPYLPLFFPPYLFERPEEPSTNDQLMSNSFSASEIPSPTPSVRSSEGSTLRDYVPRSTPTTEPEEIRSTAPAQHNGAETVSDQLIYSTHLPKPLPDHIGNDGKAHNEEGSDPNTPRLPPSTNGIHDLENIPCEAATSLDLSNQSIPTASSLSAGFKQNQSPISPTRISSNSLSESIAQNVETRKERSRLVFQPSGRQDLSRISHQTENSPWTKTVSLASDRTPVPRHTRTELRSVSKNSRMSGTWSQEEEHGSEDKAGERPRSSMEQALSEKRTRSSSRSSQTRVEKRIEATLADAEPSSNARSRKSSHMLGLFKENLLPHENPAGDTSLQDAKKPKENPRTSSRDAPESSTMRGQLSANRPLEDERQEKLGVDTKENKQRTTQDAEKILNDVEKTDYDKLLPDARRTTKPSSASVASVSNSESIIGGQSSRNVNSSQEVGEYPQHKIPARLLEEIRDHHNIAAPIIENFRSPQPKTTGSQLDVEEIGVPSQHREPVSKNQPGYGSSPLIKTSGEPDEEENESDKEQISSALYYPHQAPSPDALEDVNIDEARKSKESENDEQSSLSEPALPIGDEHETRTENVDIALQSRNRNRYLHGDLQRSQSISEELIGKPVSESGFSSASDSEYESFDEKAPPLAHGDPSLADDGDTTPRASPNTRKSFILSRARKGRRGPATPFRAVELKPYNHQVGGHTTVFRFSKRAVCKQLSNRENEFYEVIEREHPELLKYIPR